MIAKIVSVLLLAAFFFPPAPVTSTPSQPASFSCGYNLLVDQLLQKTSPERYQDWIEKLTGQEAVWVRGKRTIIETRYSTAMFAGKDNAKAFEFVHQQLRRWVDDSQIELHAFPGYAGKPWYNLVVTFPGVKHPEEIIVLSAHLDSKSSKPFISAPGADDNATGSAALIEAVRIFQDAHFERTLKVIFFTGEEWGMLGSQAYMQDHLRDRILGVINLDMFGYDGDNDRCFEIHVGMLPASDDVGNCVKRSIQAYSLNLTYDYVTNQARSFSDHSSFWNEGIGAVLLMENMFQQRQPDGCAQPDNNPRYHSTQDTLAGVSLPYAYDIARAGLAAAAAMAIPTRCMPGTGCAEEPEF